MDVSNVQCTFRNVWIREAPIRYSHIRVVDNASSDASVANSLFAPCKHCIVTKNTVWFGWLWAKEKGTQNIQLGIGSTCWDSSNIHSQWTIDDRRIDARCVEFRSREFFVKQNRENKTQTACVSQRLPGYKCSVHCRTRARTALDALDCDLLNETQKAHAVSNFSFAWTYIRQETLTT